MKKYYCDHCGKEIDSKHITLLGLVRPDESVLSYDKFQLCDKCREEFFGWLNNKPAEVPAAKQPKEAKKAEFSGLDDDQGTRRAFLP